MAAFLLAPGAGAPSSHPRMQQWRRLLAELGPVRAFDYPYQRAGRRAPDRLPRLLEAHRAELEALRAEHPGEPVVLVGRSMGSRVGALLAAQEPVAAVIALGYPLRPPRHGVIRDEALLALRVPTLLVSGDRDPFAPVPLLEEVAARCEGPVEVLRVPGADHGLKLRKRDLAARRIDQEDVDRDILGAIAEFLRRHGVLPA